MPSIALGTWRTAGAQALDEIESAHAAVGGTGPGRRYATQQINQAYAVMLSSQFQRFCRDLHTEATAFLVSQTFPLGVRVVFRARLTDGRKLDTGNPNPGNIGADFGRFDVPFWPRVLAHDARNVRRRQQLEELNAWRNAVAHQDVDPARLGGRTVLGLAQVQTWRRSCDGLAHSCDLVLAAQLEAIIGTWPW